MPQAVENKGDPGATAASLLVLIALGVFAWSAGPLQSARPSGGDVQEQDHRYDDEIPARLWQDPFRAVADHQQAIAKTGVKEPKVRSLRTDVAAAVREAGHGENEGPQLTILLAPVYAGSHAEMQERRRRRRYAILSGLGDSHFVPRTAESLWLYSHAEGGESAEVPIPYEWYDLERARGDGGPARSAVVLWLDEAWMSDAPFRRIDELLRGLLEGGAEPGRIQLVMLGPSRSGTLRKMVDHREEAKDLGDRGLRAFYILSPNATVADSELDPSLPQDVGSQLDRRLPNPLLGAPFTEPCAAPSATGEEIPTCMRFLRTIRSDADLIRKLADELWLREVRQGDSVVALSEWDTYFGRSLPPALEAALEAVARKAQKGEEEEKGKKGPDLKLYTYQRGIDGITPGVAASRPRDEPAPREPGEEPAIRRPIGTGQFDYLRRLADLIRERDRALRVRRGRGIEAVAILGSDVYDKLLVLRALRSRLPGAIWVTTDLDANLLHPDEFAWARNLVVASTYGLRLPTDIQPASAPFRDSYQTANYLATRMAMDEKMIEELWREGLDRLQGEPFPGQRAFLESLPPILFEIGRRGVVRLSDTSPAGGDSEPGAINRAPTADRRHRLCGGDNELGAINCAPTVDRRYQLAGGLLLCVLAIAALHQLRPRSGRMVLGLGALLLAVIGLLFVASLGEEPLAIGSGVSVWPTVTIRVSAIAATMAFVWLLLQRLRQSREELHHRYFDGPAPIGDARLTLAEAVRRVRAQLSQRPAGWIIASHVLLASLVAAMFLLRSLKLSALATLAIQLAALAGILVAWWGYMYKVMKVRSINAWRLPTPDAGVADLWQQYAEYGESRERVLRSAATTLLYFTAGLIVFTLLGGGGSPCRGRLACGVDGAVLGLSVILMQFLLFLVVDAIRLCICWIEKLAELSIRSDEGCVARLAERLQLPASHAAHWLLVHIIGERTREVGRLIYGPLLVALLMLLARSTYFDDWSFPLALAVVVGLYFSIALGAAYKLNLTAQGVRDEIVERLRLEGRQLRAEASGAPPEPSPGQIDGLVEQLAKLDVGAYRRVWDQPLLRVSLLLLTAFGLTYLEYLKVAS